jgi:uncharacterized protein
MPHQCTNCGHTFPDGSKEMLSGCPDCGGNKFQFAPNSGSTVADATDPGSDADQPDSGAASSSSGESDPDGVASRAAETVRGWVSSGSPDESNAAATADAESTERTDADPTAGTTESTAATADSSPVESADSKPRSTDETDDGFAEWPDSARRPEDRSVTDQSVTAQSVTESRSGERSVESADSSARANETSPAGIETPDDTESEDSAQADARSEVVPADDLPQEPRSGSGSGPITDVGTSAETGPDSGRDQPPDNGRVVSEPSGEQPSIEDLRAELNEQFESIKIVRPGQYELNLMELYNRDEYIISLQEDGRYVIDVPDSWHDGANE